MNFSKLQRKRRNTSQPTIIKIKRSAVLFCLRITSAIITRSVLQSCNRIRRTSSRSSSILVFRMEFFFGMIGSSPFVNRRIPRPRRIIPFPRILNFHLRIFGTKQTMVVSFDIEFPPALRAFFSYSLCSLSTFLSYSSFSSSPIPIPFRIRSISSLFAIESTIP